MTEIQVGFEQLRSTQEQVAATARQIDQQLLDLKDYLAPVVASWTGTAFETYRAKQTEWDAAATDLNAVLASIGTTLAEIAASYEGTERRIAGTWA